MIIFLYYDRTEIDGSVLEQKIQEISVSVYRNGSNQLFVNYKGSCKSLYDNIHSIVGENNVLLLNITSDYWGYQDKELWEWLNENRP